MRLTFWGTRGSFAKPGPSTVRYGGNTSCVQVESPDGTLVILDCGTGVHALGQALMAAADGPIRGHILISHTHWDHIQGIPFFTPLFKAGNEWEIYGPQGLGESVRETLAGQMQYTYFPVTLDALGADVEYHNLVEGSFQVGDIRVRTRYLNHPALTLGYRLEVGGVTVVYACDHEPHARDLAVAAGDITGQDAEHAEFLRGADLVIHDAQYTSEEYPDKVGWGHGTPDYAVRVCRSVGVKRLALTHHEPMRGDDEIDRMVEDLVAGLEPDAPPIEVFAAAEGQVIELAAETLQAPDEDRFEETARSPIARPSTRRGLIGLSDSADAELIDRAAADDDLELTPALGREEILERYVSTRPSIVILENGDEGIAQSRSIRAVGDEHALDVPVILVGGAEPGSDDSVSDWLVSPFSVEYARSRIRAWLLRVECRWQRAPTPQGEAQRLATLHGLDLLDTDPEERFDRITRLAAALFDVPMSWVSLIDSDRQWFKSQVGVPVPETPRDHSLCSHTILTPEPLVVPDLLLDDRFADSPNVAGPPHARFYAGCPVVAGDGHTVGTLCIGDLRPRDLSEKELRSLRDLADLVEVELGR